MAALVFTIPLLVFMKPAAVGTFFSGCAGYFIGIFLRRIFHIARSLEERIPLRGRVKSASEIEITCIEV